MTMAVNREAPSTGSSDSTIGSSPGDGAEMIPLLRGQIDALDASIIALVAERARVSQRVQAARVNSGGTRIELGRERVVLASYRQGLGSEGPTLADAVLQVCRGSR